MRQETFQLPSGAQVEFRAMTVAEEDLLSSQRGKRQALIVDKLLDACCVGVVEPGPYSDLSKGQKPDWKKMLGGDRYAAFIWIRTISFRDGHIYEFDTTCPRCEARGEYTVDILDEFTVQEMTADSLEVFRAGGTFATQIGGKTVRYRHALGSDEERFEKLQEAEPDKASSCALRTRITEVEGLGGKDILAWLSKLSSEDAEDLRDEMDENDCGIDTETEVRCQKCGNVSLMDVPFGIGFFLPGRGRRKRKKQRRLKRSATES